MSGANFNPFPHLSTDRLILRRMTLKDDNEISESLKEFISNKKDGYQVFFSDIYKRTLAAELKGFCLPYDETIWMGSSTSFYFVFDEGGKIEEVYSGISIHYN